MSKTAYEIETELGGSGPNRTGFGGRPELINFYVESPNDLSALPVLDQMTIDAFHCGKIIPVITFADLDGVTVTGIVDVGVSDTEVIFSFGRDNTLVYTIETKTWADGT